MANGATEQVVDTGTKVVTKDQGPSDPQDAYNRFLKVYTEKEAAAKLNPSGDDKGKGQEAGLDKKGDGDKKGASKNPWEGLRIVDKDGNPAKLPISVDGESIELDDINKIGSAVQFGFHHEKKGETFKTEKEDFDRKVQEWELENASIIKGMPFLTKIKKAIEAGTLKISDDGTVTKVSGKEIDPDHIPISDQDEELADTQYVDLVKRFNKMIDSNKQQSQVIDGLRKLQLGQLYEKKKTELDSEISKLQEKFPLATEEPIYNLLAEVNDQKMPKYTVEEAMKTVQENAKKLFSKYIESDPEHMNKTKEQKEQIIKEYLDTVKEKNKHPVSGPQGTGAAGASLEKTKPDPSKPITPQERKTMASESFSKGASYLNQKLAQANKT